MKVLIGQNSLLHGTVEITPDGLLCTGPKVEHVRSLVAANRRWWDRSGILHILSDEELLRSLTYRIHHGLWSIAVPEDGTIPQQPPYDPWGDLWKS